MTTKNPARKSKRKPKTKQVAHQRPGQPTKYRQEYCKAVVDYMGQGYSLTAFAGRIGTSRDTVYEWEASIPEFSDAVKAARSARVATLEEQMMGAAEGPRVTARIFALKNACPQEWKEKVLSEITGADGGPLDMNMTVEFIAPKKRD